MSVDLTKGQRFNLTKATDGETAFYIGLSWDTPPAQGSLTWDCDSSVFVCALDAEENAKIISKNHVVYFGNLSDPNRAVVHSGDNLTGEGTGDDEQIRVYLDKLPPEAAELPIVVTLYDAVKKKQNFGQVKKCKVRVCSMDAAGNPTTEHMRLNLTEDYSEFTVMVPGQIYKREDGDWAFNSVEKGYAGADLNTIVAAYS